MPDTATRFLAKTDVRPDDCWLWKGGTQRGWAQQIYHEGGRLMVAHFALLHFRSIIVPDGMETDHLCHTEALRNGTCDGGPTCPHRRCVNPWHLEVVTRSENTARRVRTSCRRGHEYTPENTYIGPDGKRVCRACRDPRRKAWVSPHSC